MTLVFEVPVYENAEPGIHPAVLCDVVDLGEVEGRDGPYRACRLVWQLDKDNVTSEGKRFTVSRQFGTRMGKKSKLFSTVKAMLGKEPVAPFDPEDLIGKNCQVQIEHSEKEGTIYANVEAVVPAAKGAPKVQIDKDYVRYADRDDN